MELRLTRSFPILLPSLPEITGMCHGAWFEFVIIYNFYLLPVRHQKWAKVSYAV